MNRDSVTDALRALAEPPDDCRPTPLYWWSGGDLDRPRRARDLAELQAMGLGGTIVGYSHLADSSVDAGSPSPFSAAWWEDLRWFVTESSRRGLTVGFQDYGFLGDVFLRVGQLTNSLHGGMLRERSCVVADTAASLSLAEGERLVTAKAWPTGKPSAGRAPDHTEGQGVRWDELDGEWTASIVILTSGRIKGAPSMFDPLHPYSAQAVIADFYDGFNRELGAALGTSFTTFFQDELDFGVTMPMWNDDVAESFFDAGFSTGDLHALWHDQDISEPVRVAVSDIVVALLSQRYFEPISAWMHKRGLVHVMDQMSRGDLQLGARYYGDFLRTMRTYDGPGHDDPDIFGPRNVVAAAVSASIAASSGGFVAVEAFHSSGWGVDPARLLSETNALFALGMNQLILHGLYTTTQNGDWEWAPPDFHFRQPWWQHSCSMWRHIHRLSSVSRCGRRVTDIAVVDTASLNPDDPVTGRSFAAVVEALAARGNGVTVVPSSSLRSVNDNNAGPRLDEMGVRGVVVPLANTIQAPYHDQLAFLRARGLHVVTDEPAAGTTRGAASTEPYFPAAARRVWSVDPDVLISHRALSDGELYLVMNRRDETREITVDFEASGTALLAYAETSAPRPLPIHVDAARRHIRLFFADQELVVIIIDRREKEDSQ